MQTITNEDNSLKIGSKLLEFEILSVLGQGGFGITYKVRDTNIDKIMVIKEYMPSAFASRTQTTVTHSLKDTDNFRWGLESFLEEAKVLSKFDHPNIIKATRLFEANGTAYFVMDFYEGETLSSYLEKNQKHKFTQDEIISVIMPILEGLKAVHKAGFLHRDIAPDNIFMRQTKPPILIDFGASRNALGVKSQNISAIVKHGYSPPEQYTSTTSKQNKTTDLYALSAVIFYLISNQKPPESTHRQTELFDGEIDPIIDIKDIYKDRFSTSFLDTVTRGLSIKQKDRIASVEEYQRGLMGEDTEPSEENETTEDEQKTKKIETQKVEPKKKTAEKREDNTGAEKSSMNILLIVIIVLLLGLIGGGAWYVLNEKSQERDKIVQEAKNHKNKNDRIERERLKKELAEAKEKVRLSEELAEKRTKDKALRDTKEKAKIVQEIANNKEKARQNELRRLREELKRQRIERDRQEKLKRERDEAEKQKRENEEARERERQRVANEKPVEKKIYFNENRIYIEFKYPSFVKAGDSFILKVEMTNNNRRARQGGLTLSFPDMNDMSGTSLNNNFSSLNGYSNGNKIYNKNTRKNMSARYFMVEGWQNRTWSKGRTKYFSVRLTAPRGLNKLRINLRGVLWITGSHDLREIPYSSSRYDQQGFGVKQFSIRIKGN